MHPYGGAKRGHTHSPSVYSLLVIIPVLFWGCLSGSIILTLKPHPPEQERPAGSRLKECLNHRGGPPGGEVLMMAGFINNDFIITVSDPLLPNPPGGTATPVVYNDGENLHRYEQH